MSDSLKTKLMQVQAALAITVIEKELMSTAKVRSNLNEGTFDAITFYADCDVAFVGRGDTPHAALADLYGNIFDYFGGDEESTSKSVVNVNSLTSKPDSSKN